MPRDQYLDPYRHALVRYGTDFEVTLWASHRTQLRRFEVFTQMIDLTGTRVMDAGCSRGDFASFLNGRGVAYGSYVGLDGMEQVIAYARTRRLPRAQFHSGDFLHDPSLLTIGDPQVICISGTLNTMTERQIFSLIESAWNVTNEALVFNFLSDLALTAAAAQTDPSRRHSTVKLLRWAASRTGHVQYRQDYLRYGHDATILMRKA